MLKKKGDAFGGARTHDHKVKSLALYRLSYEGLVWALTAHLITFLVFPRYIIYTVLAGLDLWCVARAS